MVCAPNELYDYNSSPCLLFEYDIPTGLFGYDTPLVCAHTRDGLGLRWKAGTQKRPRHLTPFSLSSLHFIASEHEGLMMLHHLDPAIQSVTLGQLKDSLAKFRKANQVQRQRLGGSSKSLVN